MEASAEVPSLPPLGSKSRGLIHLHQGLRCTQEGVFPWHGQGKLWWPENPQADHLGVWQLEDGPGSRKRFISKACGLCLTDLLHP